MTTILGRLAMLAALACASPAHGQLVSALQPGMPRADVEALAAQQLQAMRATLTTSVQRVNTTTDPNGAWSVTWSSAFTSTSPIVEPHPVQVVGQLPIVCRVLARSSTAASGDCMQSTTTTLGGTLAGVVGTVINPFGSKAPNAPLMVIGGEPTQ